MEQRTPQVLTLSSPEETIAFAWVVADHLGLGSVILLSGDLGVGKTHFARAVIQARLAANGLYEEVPSPTYTLVQTYHDGICEIWHVDLYRLAGPGGVEELGLTDAFENNICLIEWPDRLGALQPPGALHMEFFHGDDDNTRFVKLSWETPVWEKLIFALNTRDV